LLLGLVASSSSRPTELTWTGTSRSETASRVAVARPAFSVTVSVVDSGATESATSRGSVFPVRFTSRLSTEKPGDSNARV
jgi:hypothetical protein